MSVRESLHRIRVLVRKEYLQIFRDRATIVQIFFVPVVQLLILSNAATFEVTRARMHLVDLDGTRTSRGLVEHMVASGRFTVESRGASLSAADDELRAGRVTLIVAIPRDFERDLVRTGTAPVQLQVDAQEGASAGIVQGYAASIVAEYARQATTELRPGAVAASSVRPTQRFVISDRGWYNPRFDFKHYMVPGILVSLTTVIGLLLAAQNIAREKELGTLEQLNVTPVREGEIIASKLIPFWVLALFLFSLGLVIGRLVFGIPMLGSLWVVFLGAAIYLVVALGIGLWISAVASTQQQTIFIAFFFMMIFLLMSGIFTPVDAMPEWAQAMAQLNPVKHFVVLIRAVLVRGAGFVDVLPELGTLAVYGVVILSLAVRQYKRTTA